MSWIRFLALWSIATGAFAAEFPELSGRVVDQANLLSAATEGRITNVLAEHEANTTNQVVVVTVESLEGSTIEEYGYALGRHWGIGQKDRDNGALLIVAVAERRIRIEVGYGLEGALTDAIASNIIRHAIRPRFKQGQFEEGIQAGVDAMLAAIAGEYQSAAPKGGTSESEVILIVAFLVIILLIIIASSRGGSGGGRSGAWAIPGMLGSGSRSSGGFGGGFGGGGGGFGGGGASGGW